MTNKTHIRLIMLAVLAVGLTGQYMLPAWFEEQWYWRLPSTAFQLGATLVAWRLTRSSARQSA